jgi:CRISPR-associated protein Csm5
MNGSLVNLNYRVTCITPTLVGDGYKLSPIDYMVWRDQVNVLDQTRIFKLLAKGARLDGYLTQIKKATKLDFASWGGFAQNYAGRRIPFEHPASARHWERAATEQLAIPTFASGASGPYLPAAAIKGALRTGLLFDAVTPNSLRHVADRATGDRPLRHPGDAMEGQLLGVAGHDRMRVFSAADSKPISYATFKIYMLRVSTLTSKGPDNYALAWKLSGRGSSARIEDGTPSFAEMAEPGTFFEGRWTEKQFWEHRTTRETLFNAVNKYAEAQLALHAQYANWTGIEALKVSVEQLQGYVAEARKRGGCLLSIGWGAGFTGKSAVPDATNPDNRKILAAQPFYQKAIASGLPFPKTRRIVFLEDHPVTLPGWVLLEVA